MDAQPAAVAVVIVAPARCRSCEAEIFFAHTDGGAYSPFDAAPVPDGRWLLALRGGKIVATYANEARRAEATTEERNLFKTHFATCPHADEHRKRGDAPDGPGPTDPPTGRATLDPEVT